MVSIVLAWLGYLPSAHEYPNSLRSSKNHSVKPRALLLQRYRPETGVTWAMNFCDSLIESLKLVL